MAGIGFELRKIFKERGVVSMIKGAFYSTFAVVGPMLITIIGFLLLFIITGYQYVDYASRDLLVSIILYVFVFSLILTSPLSAIVSRYIADRIFEEDIPAVMPCYYSGLLINVAIGVVFCVPFSIAAVARGGVDPLVMLSACTLFMALLMVYYNMTFISALKEYKTIAVVFLAGMAVTLTTSIAMFMLAEFHFLISIVTGMATGFIVIAFVLFALIKGFFVENNGDYKGLLSYLWRFKLLFFTNMFYILGLYVHNFVFWGASSLSITIADVFHSAPVYDTAAFAAMLTNVSTIIIFTVRVETNFHERYQIYCQQLLGGIGKDIAMAKNNMFLTLVKEIQYIVQVQTGISIIIFLIFMTFASFFGFGGSVMTIYPSLAAGYFVIFVMYCAIIFLYYFDDGFGAFIAAFVFFATTLAAALISTSLRPSLYGISTFVGALCGWTAAFLRLRYIERNINRQMYCKGELVGRVYV